MGGSSSKTKERINEVKTNHEAHISERSTEKLFNSIVRISFSLDEEDFIGTGFFMKFNLKNEMKYFLITCQHVIKEIYVDKKLIISTYYGKVNEEEKLEIKLDKNKRNIKCFDFNGLFDVTLIEILEEDSIKEDKYLEPDWSYKNGYKFYENKDYYLAGYPSNNSNENERSISSGKITKILEKPEFEHSLDTGPGSSGSPICLRDNLFVVGIHKQGNKDKPINYGTFLGYILDNLENEGNNLKKINEEENIENSKLFRERNRVVVSNKIEKEYYDKGELKFNGEYLNGERNGKGKEYFLWYQK